MVFFRRKPKEEVGRVSSWATEAGPNTYTLSIFQWKSTQYGR